MRITFSKSLAELTFTNTTILKNNIILFLNPEQNQQNTTLKTTKNNQAYYRSNKTQTEIKPQPNRLKTHTKTRHSSKNHL